ncbi:MAG: TfoX/Sxy family protein [Gemmataceae bacterium]
MFGGLCFLLHGNLLVCVWKDALIVRLKPEEYQEALLEPHVRKFDVTGRPMKGWVMVESEATEEDDGLKAWIERAINFVRTLPKK